MKLKPTLIALAVSSVFAGSVQAQTTASKTEQQALTQFNRSGALVAWGRGFTGQGIRVAVLDSGFDLTNTDLKGQVAGAKNFSAIVTANTTSNPNNFRSNIQSGTDITWSLHGTQMASIIAGRLDNNGAVGIAPNAQLLLAQVGQGVVWNSSSKSWTYSNTGISSSSLNAALTWAEANGASVANMSLGSSYDKTFQRGVVSMGGGVYRAPIAYGSMYGNTAATLTAFANASKTMVLVAAAGNEGLPYAQFPGAYATQVDKNGNLVLGGRMLIVGSVNANNVISSFSNRAGSFCTNFSGTTCADKYYVKDFFVVAPGEVVVSSLPNQLRPGNTTNYVTGTSPAAAYVSGGIALMKQAWPQLRAEQLVQLVKDTATDLGAKGVDEIYGHGLVNFDKATQPTGSLRFASAMKGVTASGTPVAGTGVAISGTSGFGTSSILRNTMTVDGIGRHYGVDLTKAQVSNRLSTYQFGSSWLALNPAGYREVALPVNENYGVKVMQTETGFASQLDYHNKDVTYSFQYGSMTEKSGFLGTYGAGALALGDSSTTYAQFGIGKQFDDVQVFGAYGMAVTNAGSVQDSMIKFNGRIVSQSWKLGIAKSNVLQAKDSVSLTLISPVQVRNGSATVTGVTDYQFADAGNDEVTATPVVTSEVVNLRSTVRPLDLVLGYTVTSDKYSKLSVNFAHQFNVGGVNGQTSNGIGLSYVKLF